MVQKALNNVVHSHINTLFSYNTWTDNLMSSWKEKNNIVSKKGRREKVKNKIPKTKSIRKNKNKLGRKRIISTFLKNSSIYVLNRIGKSTTSAQKIFWFIIFLLGIAGCLSQILQFLISYFSYPVVINLDSISPKFQIFPAVTICNANNIRRQFEKCLFKKLNYEECTGVNQTNVTEVFDAENTTLPECDEDLSDFPSRNSSLSNWYYLLLSQSYSSRVKYGHQLEDFMQLCAYSGKYCNTKHFKLSISYDYGNCYTFNAGEIKLSTQEYGPIGGLLLELNLETEKYATFTRSVGAIVQIHDPYLEHSINTKGIFLSPGYETNIAVTKSVISRLEPPYKDKCRNYELGDSQSNCDNLCYDNITVSLCSCIVGSKLETSIPQCDVTDPHVWCCLSMCDQKASKMCDCPLPCEEIAYDTQVSSTIWPSRIHFEQYKHAYLRRNDTDILSYEEFRETRLRLKVYYDTLDYIVFKQSPMYQSSQIFSQVGGQMGLWLGLSLVVICECLETVFVYFKSKK